MLGEAVGLHLLNSNYNVTVFNLTYDKTEKVVQFGATIANFLGANTITISDKNRKINIRPIFNLLKNNHCIAITPDGPRGPKEKVSEGIIKIAKQSSFKSLV